MTGAFICRIEPVQGVRRFAGCREAVTTTYYDNILLRQDSVGHVFAGLAIED